MTRALHAALEGAAARPAMVLGLSLAYVLAVLAVLSTLVWRGSRARRSAEILRDRLARSRAAGGLGSGRGLGRAGGGGRGNPWLDGSSW